MPARVEARDRSDAFSITFKANPLQYAFITSRAEADLWACRMGEGKSTGLAWSIFHFTQANPGAIVALIRDTFENLRDTTMKDFFSWFPSGICGNYNASEKTFTWSLGEMKGQVFMMGMDDPADATKLQSRMLGGFCMDEPAPATESGGISEDIFNTALSRCRQPGMRWYMAKLAENAPDETHWTYDRFVDPGDAGTPLSEEILPEQKRGFCYFQGAEPENRKNLPPGYYARLRRYYRHRPDQVRRFADGGFGFQQEGRPVTPQWNDVIHLADDLQPIAGIPLLILWDWGLYPACSITQVSPLGHWNFLETHVGDGDMGAQELIENIVKPTLSANYRGLTWSHTGDPMGRQREQSSSEWNAVRVMKKELGGHWYPGPTTIPPRLEPLRAVLTRTRGNTGLLQVDRRKAKKTWHALRGGWHYHVSRAGVVSGVPKKDQHSHPGDAASYGAARLFPMGELQKGNGKTVPLEDPKHARYGRRAMKPKGSYGSDFRLPRDGDRLVTEEEARGR